MRAKIINIIIRKKRSFVGVSFVTAFLLVVTVLSGVSHEAGAQAPPPPPAPTVFFDVSSLSVISSGNIDLSWNVTNAASSLPTGCTASGDWSGSKVATGMTMEIILAPSVTAAETRTYDISCTGPGGTSATQSVTVTIAPETPPVPPPVSPPITETPSPSTCPNFGLERTTIYDLQDVAYAYGYAVTTDNLGNAYMTGEQYSPERGLDMFVIKYRPDGSVAWARTYDHVVDGVSGNESGYGILVTLNGASVYVVGRQMDSISQDVNVFVRKYDGGGGVLWTQTYNSGVDRADVARAAAFDSAGNLFVAGYQQTGSGDSDMLLLSFDADTGNLNPGFPVTNGNGGPFNQSAYAIAVLGTSVYVTGYTQESISNTNIALWRYTTSGALASSWTPNPKSIDATAQVRTEEFYATQTITGSIWTGDEAKSGTYYYWARKILDFGAKTALYQYRMRFVDSITTTVDDSWDTGWRNLPTSGVVTTGFQGTRLTFAFPSASNSAGISAGSLQGCYEGGTTCASDGIPTVTTSTVAGSGDRTEIGYGVSVDGSGNVFVTGYMGSNGGDVFLQKYNADGTLAWSDSYNSGGSQNDVGRSVAVGNSGRVFVAGRQQTNGEDAFLAESFSNKNIPVYPAANPPLGLQDWTTTANYYCTDTQDAPEGWDWVVRTPCNTGSHIAMSSPVVETCLATSNGGQSWYESCPFCNKVGGSYSAQTRCYATLVERGFFTSTISRLLYKGGGGAEWEGAYAVAVAPSTLPGYESIANDVYVAGYDDGEGGAFLNKYSCNTTSSPVFNSSAIANFTVIPTTGVAPLTVKVDARMSAGSIA